MSTTLEEKYAQLLYNDLRIERNQLHPTSRQANCVQEMAKFLTDIHAQQRTQGTFLYSEQEIDLLLDAVHSRRLTDNGLYALLQPDYLTPLEMELLLIGMGCEKAKRVLNAVTAGEYVNLMTFS